MKLAAFADRGPDALSSKDGEDVVALVVEVPTLVDEVVEEGIAREIAASWTAVFVKYQLTFEDVPDLVDAHLHREDRPQRGTAIETILRLAAG